MKNAINHSILTAAALFMSTTVMAESNMPTGKVLMQEANCAKCHSGLGYHPSKTPSYPALVKRVTFCNNNLNTGWFEDEIETVSDYLNKRYYHYQK